METFRLRRDIPVDDGYDVFIAGGGGGIPLARGLDGRLRGVDAVVDKDYREISVALLRQTAYALLNEFLVIVCE